ncbi:MAG: ankyrin repeat domain-containing protein, partial [Rickettsiaceae bacterium]|nr:ankyrin repeat domain-containing protein [Rickettsiaceae bacterium]
EKLSQKVDINWKDESGLTQLHYAAKYGDVYGLGKLLENGANPNLQDKYGCTPLYYAALYNQVDILGKLSQKVDINWKDESALTQLHYAAEYGQVDVLGRLLKIPGIEINSPAQNNYTPLGCAIWYGHVKAVEILIEHGAKIDPTKENETIEDKIAFVRDLIQESDDGSLKEKYGDIIKILESRSGLVSEFSKGDEEVFKEAGKLLSQKMAATDNANIPYVQEKPEGIIKEESTSRKGLSQ